MSSQQPNNAVTRDALQQKYTFTLPLIILVLLTILTQLIGVAFTTEQSFSAVFFPSFIALLVFTIPLAALGLRLGSKIGLGTPLLATLLTRQPGTGQRLLNDLALAMVVGAGIGALLAWTAILISALAFGLIHIPQLAAADAANTVGIVATMLGNLLVGIACGWLFWRRSFLAAIFARFFVDLMLHVFPAMLG